MNTPWGKADYRKQIARGIHWVGTPGHGGLMIAAGRAKKLLSEAARKRGLVFGGYLAYEEDCQYAVAFLELIPMLPWLGKNGDYVSYDELFGRPYDETAILKTITRYNADYLLERGIAPSVAEYQRYLENEEQDRLRAEKNPDYIVSASGNDDGTVSVTTADSKEHKVSVTSYALTREAGKYRLSACEVLNG